MNDDDLKKLWQDQPLRTPPMPSAGQLIAAMQKQTSQLRRTLFARDIRELSACVIVGVIFAIYYFIYPAPVARWGSLVTVAASIFVAAKILYARRSAPAAKPDATVVESLRAELHSVQTQSQLLRSVWWWYLLPLTIGTQLFVWGQSSSLVGAISFTVICLAFDVFIYWLNQWARAKQLLPLEAQLRSLLHSAETGEPPDNTPDNTQTASLRPIVLSIAAADQVKPVEFKVAFWQLALWGEIGFVGIWFFVMLGLSLDNKDWNAVPPPQSIVHFDQTNRYSLVAKQVVERFNAGDYAAVQELYDAQMSKEFPPKETSEFYTVLAEGYGKVASIEGPIGKGYEDWPAFRLHCDHGNLTMSLALDDDENISGIYFQPEPRPHPPVAAILRRTFSWQHLVCAVPFAMAGLFYSWLIQKTTRRAVGISSLGIHLSKGQTLILWDEVKEVRPYKFLHIQNLYLITAFGEKTRMHWTPLERHADVKTAVEKFAPANHPLRQYLSLLKSTKTS